ncbi:hypothetical protein K440DRAFT_627792 [Wilcoxina mikolae CBS 423.85]|nr:hypothetical protein K440DRAFT_627792 [Wilcoxina mikolae CBS 423.85]
MQEVVIVLGIVNVDFIEYFRDFCLQYGIPCVTEMLARTGREVMMIEDMDERRVCPGCGEVFSDTVSMFEHFDNKEHCAFTCDCGEKVTERKVRETEHSLHFYRCGNCYLRADDYMQLQEHLLASPACTAGLQSLALDLELFGPDDSDRIAGAKPDTDYGSDDELSEHLRHCRLPSPIRGTKGSAPVKRPGIESPEQEVQPERVIMRGRGMSMGGARKISRGNHRPVEPVERRNGLGHGRPRANTEPNPPGSVSRGIGSIRRSKPFRH